MKKYILFLLTLFLFSNDFKAQSPSDKRTFIDTVYEKLLTQIPQGWDIAKSGTRLVFTKNDSVLCATAESEYLPTAPLSSYQPVKYKLQLYLDFIDKNQYPSENYLNKVNQNIDSLFGKLNNIAIYSKAELYRNDQQKALLNMVKLKVEKIRFLKYVNASFDDNYPDDWIVYEYKDIEHSAFKKPSVLQQQIEQMKTDITAELRRMGI